MITSGLPIRQPARVIDCGQPWHGLVEADELDYGGPGPMDWLNPDSGDVYSIHVNGAPGQVGTSPDPYHQFLDYGLISGWWGRQLYGRVLRPETPAWQSSTTYALGDIVRPGTPNDHIYACIVAGESSTSEPTWPTNSGNVADGTSIYWQDLGPERGARLTWVYGGFGAGNCYIFDLTALRTEVSFSSTAILGHVCMRSTTARVPAVARIAASSPADSLSGYTYSGAHLDLLAINQDGSEVLVGLWPAASGVTYSQAANTRAQSLYSSSRDWRGGPWAIWSLIISAIGINYGLTMEVEKTPPQTEDVDTNIDNTNNGTMIYFVVDQTDTPSYSGPNNACYRLDRDQSAQVETVTSGGVYTSETQVTNTTITQIVGAYYKPDGALAYVTLVQEVEAEAIRTRSGSGGGGITWIEGTEWDAVEEECVSVATPFTALTGQIDTDLDTAVTGSVSLKLDGVTKSSVTYALSSSVTSERYFNTTDAGNIVDTGGDGITVASSSSMDSVVIDGVNLGSKASPADAVPIPSHSGGASIGDGITVHTVRYSNNAYGLMLCGLDSSAYGNDAYLGGVVNVLTGTRGTALGGLDAPDHTLDYPYTERFVTVHPETQTLIEQDTGPVCYV